MNFELMKPALLTHLSEAEGVLVSAKWGSDQPQYKEKLRQLVQQHQSLKSSISHTIGMGGVMLAQCACGFDVENLERIKPSVIRRVMNSSDQWDDENLKMLWSAKEAAFKGLHNFLGRGSSLAPSVLSDLGCQMTLKKKEGVVFQVNWSHCQGLGIVETMEGYSMSCFVINEISPK